MMKTDLRSGSELEVVSGVQGFLLAAELVTWHLALGRCPQSRRRRCWPLADWEGILGPPRWLLTSPRGGLVVVPW